MATPKTEDNKKLLSPYDYVSVDQLKYQQLITKRATSKLVYYQSVIRRDRALISLLKEQLYKLGGSEIPQLKLPDFRLKRLDNSSDDVMATIDSEEDRLYRDFVEQHLSEAHYPDEVMWPHADRSRSGNINKNLLHTTSVSLEKYALVELHKVSLRLPEAEPPLPTNKRQIAMKSTRGKVPRRKRPQAQVKNVSSQSANSPINAPKKECNSSSLSEDDLISRAKLEGKAFEELKAKLCLIDKCKESDRSPVRKPTFTSNANRKSDSPDKKKVNSKKIPRELIDDDYIPEDLSKFSNIADVPKEMKIRDDELFDIYTSIRYEDLPEKIGLCDAKTVPDSLRKDVVKFVVDATHLERALFNVGSGDECSVLGEQSKKHTGPYRDHFISILHQRFLATCRQTCSLKVFAQCLPHNMVRKTALGRGFSSCLSCATAEILFENLVAQQIIDVKSDFEDILIDGEMRAVLCATLECVTDLDRKVSSFTWMKNFKGNFARSVRSVDETVGSLVSSFKQELINLEDHLYNINVKFSVIRAALRSSEVNQGEAVLHITWCDNPKVYRKSPSGHTMVDQSISLLSGYVWLPNNEYSFVCLSDQRDRSSPSLWAHLEEALNDIVNLGFTKLFIVSDPPIHLFRNKGHFYHMNEYAVRQNIQIRWFFSATCHTYFNADVTGLKVKEVIEKKTSAIVKSMGDNPYVKAEDIIDFLRDKIDTIFYYVKREDVERNVQTLPNLQSIRGTPTFAEVMIAPGKFYVKFDSSEEYWTKIIVIF